MDHLTAGVAANIRAGHFIDKTAGAPVIFV
jgi:hypothetical protein